MGDVKAVFSGRVEDVASVAREFAARGFKGMVLQAVSADGENFSHVVAGSVDAPEAAYMALVLQRLAVEAARNEGESK